MEHVQKPFDQIRSLRRLASAFLLWYKLVPLRGDSTLRGTPATPTLFSACQNFTHFFCRPLSRGPSLAFEPGNAVMPGWISTCQVRLSPKVILNRSTRGTLFLSTPFFNPPKLDTIALSLSVSFAFLFYDTDTQGRFSPATSPAIGSGAYPIPITIANLPRHTIQCPPAHWRASR